MKTKHTPAPWIIQNEDSAETVFYIQCKSGNLGSAYNKAGGEGLANARLIAGAPELLEALQNFVESIDLIVEGQKIGDIPDTEKYSAYSRIQKSMTYIKAKEAIKKATE